ncbi:MAG: PAS domain S-box protein [Proteobacteria bacterium]|nr:PAS domain S-box protein [Pseudomonadota bacterium]
MAAPREELPGRGGLRDVGSRAWAFGFATAAVAVVTAIRIGVDPLVEGRSLLILFILPIVLSAYYAGTTGGLWATFLASSASAYLLISRTGARDFLGSTDVIALSVLVVTGVLVTWLCGRRAASTPRLDAADTEPIERKILAGFLLAMVVIAVIGGLAYQSTQRTQNNALVASAAKREVSDLFALVNAVRDIETDAGRYVITGDEAQTVALRRAAASAREILARLPRPDDDGSARSAEYRSLATLLERRITVADDLVALRRRSLADATTAVATGEGRGLTAEINRTVGLLETAADAVAQTSERDVQYYARATQTATVIASGIALATLLAAMVLVRRGFAERRRAHAFLAQAHDTMEERVAERTAELARVNADLAAREEQFAGIVASAMDAIITTDDRFHVVLFNQAAERIFGYAAAEMMDQPLDRLIPAPERAAHPRQMAEFGRQQAAPRRMAAARMIHGVRASGEKFPIEASISQVNAAGGRYFTAILRDNTERVASDAARAESEALLRMLMDSVPVLLAHLDADRRYKFVNQAYAAWWNRDPADMIGLRIDDVVDPRLLSVTRADIQRALGGETVAFTRIVNRGDDQERYVRGVFVPESAVAGTCNGVFVMVHDQTAQRQTEQLLAQSQKLESLGTLAGGIAHDFNNILPAILGFARLAEEALPADHAARAALDNIEKAALRASDLVRRILQFARQDASSPQRIDLVDATRDALKLAHSMVPAKVSIREHFPPSPVPVMAQAAQVYQIVVNLVGNAAHAIGDAPGVIEVTVEAVDGDAGTGAPNAPIGPCAHLRVRDSGSGMTADVRARIFDPFFTTKPAGKGTGLGLSIIHGIVTTLGGTVRVDSEPGRGSTFEIALPLAADEPPVAAAAAATPARGSARRVLFVDDESALVLLARRALERLGNRVDGYDDPHAALAAFKAEPGAFDAVITDQSMPGMAGLDLAAAILAERPGQPVIVASGYVRDADRARATSLGVTAIIEKPTLMEQYAAVLDTALGGRVEGSVTPPAG